MRRHICGTQEGGIAPCNRKRYKYKKIRRTISERTTQRLRVLHRHTGDVVQKRTVDGRPRILNGFEISVDGSLRDRQAK